MDRGVVSGGPLMVDLPRRRSFVVVAVLKVSAVLKWSTWTKCPVSDRTASLAAPRDHDVDCGFSNQFCVQGAAKALCKSPNPNDETIPCPSGSFGDCECLELWKVPTKWSTCRRGSDKETIWCHCSAPNEVFDTFISQSCRKQLLFIMAAACSLEVHWLSTQANWKAGAGELADGAHAGRRP